MKFPLRIKVTCVPTGVSEVKTLKKSDFPNIKNFNNTTGEIKVINSLSVAFKSPNFTWEIV